MAIYQAALRISVQWKQFLDIGNIHLEAWETPEDLFAS